MISISGYDGWKTASPYDDEDEWEETFNPTCEAELDYEPARHTCNDNCDAAEGYHSCGWNGEVKAGCVGNEDNHTRYWSCPQCKFEYDDEVRGG